MLLKSIFLPACLCLLMATQTIADISGTSFDPFDPDEPSIHEIDKKNEGKYCEKASDCGHGFLYCINYHCRFRTPGKDCVAKGNIYVKGGPSCCPPMANPIRKGDRCKILNDTDCNSSNVCNIRHGANYYCCTRANNGQGICKPNHEKC